MPLGRWSAFSIRGLLVCFVGATAVIAQERKVDPTWLHRYVPNIGQQEMDFSSKTCHYKPIFGEGDTEKHVLKNVVRFGEADLDAHGSCGSVLYARQEELYFVLEGGGSLKYNDQTYSLSAHDFTYLAPAAKHVLSNSSDRELRVLVMTFKVPTEISIDAVPEKPEIANLDKLKEQPVEGHPMSVLYKLLVGPGTSTRDAIRAAYTVTSLFWMDFAPGGTNFPHHHQSAEEIYLVIDGEGDIVAGGGMDGVEGRHAAKAGDAYYFRPNCTVGFYNRNQGDAKAHILAVRSRILPPKEVE